MIHIRSIDQNGEYVEFLTDMMYESIHMPENKPAKEVLLNMPHIKKYSEGWGRKGDKAIIAINENNLPVGAAWYRLFTEDNKGYGYVDDKTPELGIALTKDARGKGIGTLLVKRLMEEAFSDGYTTLSLSVDPTNKEAVQLYKKLGFKQCCTSGTSWTMVCNISSI
ncbi:GCN5-related N-acetyltransferase [Evansella cellulosilytica DSM 2522]|uniref:GCN5-related N-acetyltransferase n=1 Tax=Evansella cellulosilytica (strain ATCC 21833 / DSM 2522 / FERM P-1141 / JCM 9156 / N-4) TaxID=649639 RepID=E6U1F5_EVAC2|nr:GNAT family N-acetyltransferase [Evansella cellulosilytica]ADU29202.1 GCN5-related N-acetyltransferase [Evansella cellulosilytica DSM 2522]